MIVRTPRRNQAPTPSHARSKQQEKELAQRVGGRLTSASGAKTEKGDVRKRGLLRIEAKTTKHKSFSVTTEMIDKLMDSTLGTKEIPCLYIELQLGTHKVLVIPEMYLDELISG